MTLRMKAIVAHNERVAALLSQCSPELAAFLRGSYMLSLYPIEWVQQHMAALQGIEHAAEQRGARQALEQLRASIAPRYQGFVQRKGWTDYEEGQQDAFGHCLAVIDTLLAQQETE